MAEQLIQTVHHNEKFKEFLDNLPNQHDRDVAGMTMTWMRETYPQVAEVLLGELVWEHTTGRLREK